MSSHLLISFFFFFNDTATTEIYTLSLHDALPICDDLWHRLQALQRLEPGLFVPHGPTLRVPGRSARRRRSEEHTSELQSPCNLVCRLLLEKKKNIVISRQASLSLTTSLHAYTVLL